MTRAFTFKLRNLLINVNLIRRTRYFLFDFHDFVSNRKFKILRRVIEQKGINTIVDVGANIGQFGLEMRRIGFKGQLFSYEPVTESFDFLAKKVFHDDQWECFKLGLGSRLDEVKIGVSNNFGLSSSILPILSSHVENSPTSKFGNYETIKLTTLDDEISRLGIVPNSALVKIDVQGYELEVLRGNLHKITDIAALLIEVSLIELYSSSPTLKDILEFFEEQASHQLVNIFRSFSTSNGELLQIDILLVSR